MRSPLDSAAATALFVNNPNNRQNQPRAYPNDYSIPEQVWQYTASVQQELGERTVVTAAYLGAQGRNLFLRSIANPIVGVQSNGAAAATVVRAFDLITCSDGQSLRGSLCSGGATISSINRPYAEIDTKTSGGHDNYNALQMSVSRHATRSLTLNAQYTLARSFGNASGSNEALTAGNTAQTLADFDYD